MDGDGGKGVFMGVVGEGRGEGRREGGRVFLWV